MSEINKETLMQMVELHKKWLHNESDGVKADFSGKDLRGANLCEVTDVLFIPMACQEDGSFIGWKKAGKWIVKLLIPEDALRSSATSRKCRCDKAKVLEIQEMDGSKSILLSM